MVHVLAAVIVILAWKINRWMDAMDKRLKAIEEVLGNTSKIAVPRREASDEP